MGDPIYASKATAEPERIWRLAIAERVGVIIAGLVTLAISVTACFADRLRGDDVMAAASMAVASGAFFAGAFLTSLTLTNEKVVVRNLGWTRSVPLTSITRLEPGYAGIEITTSTGRRLTATAVLKSNASNWSGRHTRADDVVAAIREAAARKADGSSGINQN